MRFFILFNVVAAVMISSCQNFQLKTSRQQKEAPAEEVTYPPQETEVILPVEAVSKAESYAVILGPGALRSYAHAGVLRELARANLPIRFIAGLGQSALPALLFADDPSPSQVEWPFFKYTQKDWESKDAVEKQARQLVKSEKLEQLKIAFACPSYSSAQGKAYIHNKGQVWSAFAMCYYNFSQKPQSPSHSHPVAIASLISLAKTYADNIIYVDLLTQLPTGQSAFNYQWGLVAEAIRGQLGIESQIVWIKPQLKGDLNDFSRRNEWVRAGADTAKKWLSQKPK